MKYIGIEHTETFFVSDGIPSAQLERETNLRIKILEQCYPGFTWFETRQDYADVPQEVFSEREKVVVGRGTFYTIVMRKSKSKPEPGPYKTNLPVSQAVLTKRELIAAMALQGLLSNSDVSLEVPNKIINNAVLYSDNLLKELE